MTVDEIEKIKLISQILNNLKEVVNGILNEEMDRKQREWSNSLTDEDIKNL